MAATTTTDGTARGPRFFIIEGSIGAGKSTLLQQVQRVLERRGWTVTLVPEPVDLWVSTGALAAFYQDPATRAYEFQTFVYATRIQRIREYVQAHPRTDVFLIERSVVSDRHLFAHLLEEDGCFTPLQSTLYRHWVELWNHLLPFTAPDGFIYLAPSVDATLQRIQRRGREGETVSRDYQEKLHRRHEQVFGRGLDRPSERLNPRWEGLDVALTPICGEPSTPVLRLFSDDDYRHNDDHSVLQHIQVFIESFMDKLP